MVGRRRAMSSCWTAPPCATCWAATPGTAAGSTAPAATSTRWRWRAAWRGRCCAPAGAIFARSPATGLEREGDRWVLRTSRGGELRARALVLATNAYSLEFTNNVRPDDRAAGGARAVLADGDPAADGQPARHHHPRPAGDVRHPWRAVVRALRRARPPGHRRRPRRARSTSADRLKPYIGGRLRRIWPQLGEVRFTHVWNGYVGMTPDFLPRIHRLGPDAFAWAGCNGRAVALSVALGRELAAAARGADPETLALPFSEPRPVPLHRLAKHLAPLALLAYRRRDARELA